MNNPLEKFKFATIKNASIEVRETDDSIEIKIFPVNTEKSKATDKKIVINYSPTDHYNTGDFHLEDNHKEVIVERSYPIATLDDVDWDCEQIYPCERCESKEHNYTIERQNTNLIKEENTGLRKILRDIVNLMN